MPARLKVFIDYQNAYMRARSTFGDPTSMQDYRFGQISPAAFGQRLLARGERAGRDRALSEVRIYRGRPDPHRDPVGHLAVEHQISEWERHDAIRAFTRPLTYRSVPRANIGKRQQTVLEKGIDVMLAVDMVCGALRDEFDVAILMSADTDLLPAAEAVLDAGKWLEFAAWRPDRGHAPYLKIDGRSTWCHQLGRADFEAVSDPTDYTRRRR